MLGLVVFIRQIYKISIQEMKAYILSHSPEASLTKVNTATGIVLLLCMPVVAILWPLVLISKTHKGT